MNYKIAMLNSIIEEAKESLKLCVEKKMTSLKRSEEGIVALDKVMWDPTLEQTDMFITLRLIRDILDDVIDNYTITVNVVYRAEKKKIQV